jgi:mRNA-degrading endonuclease RelE of RelBE toxin-antitoxin system
MAAAAHPVSGYRFVQSYTTTRAPRHEREPGLTIFSSGYNLARVGFEIFLAPEAIEDLRLLKANARANVRAALERHLRHEPRKTSRSRIKRLRGVTRPRYRLRVGEVRVFYDVSDSTVEILAIVPKSEVDLWLARYASPQ